MPCGKAPACRQRKPAAERSQVGEGGRDQRGGETRSRVCEKMLQGLSSSSICRLRGLPYGATETEIIDFFAGHDVKHLHICRRAGKSDIQAFPKMIKMTPWVTVKSVVGKYFQQLPAPPGWPAMFPLGEVYDDT